MGKKILIVEDEAYIVKAFADHFKREGYDVAVALDGEEGLMKAREFKPDLILLDIIMPKMDGLEMLKKLKEDPMTKGISVIMLTNLETSQSVAETMKAGSTGYLIKVNYSLEELGEEVKKALSL